MVCFAETRDIFWWGVLDNVSGGLERETAWLAEKECEYVCRLVCRVKHGLYLTNLSFSLREFGQ